MEVSNVESGFSFCGELRSCVSTAFSQSIQLWFEFKIKMIPKVNDNENTGDFSLWKPGMNEQHLKFCLRGNMDGCCEGLFDADNNMA